MYQVRVVLDKSAQAAQYFKISRSKWWHSIVMTLSDLLLSQSCLLILHNLVPANIEVLQVSILFDDFQELCENCRPQALPTDIKIGQSVASSDILTEFLE